MAMHGLGRGNLTSRRRGSSTRPPVTTQLRPAALVALGVLLAALPACTAKVSSKTSTTTSTSSTTTVPTWTDPTTVRNAFTVDGSLLDVEAGVEGDVFYTEVNSAGVLHVRDDGAQERIGADMWRPRLNAYVGFRHIAVAPDGTLYVSDSTTLRIWKVEPVIGTGGQRVYSTVTPTVVAGRGKSCYDTAFELYPQTNGAYTKIAGGACYQYKGWFLDNPDYGISLETGEPDDGPVATEALLTPWGIDVSADESRLAIAEVGAGRGPAIRVVDLNEGTISTAAGWVPNYNKSCDHPSLAEGRPAVGEQDSWGTFKMPFCDAFDVAFAPSGQIVFTAGSYYSGKIEGGVLAVVDDPFGKILDVLVSCGGSSCVETAGQPGTSTYVSAMIGLDVRGDGTVFYADTARHLVRKIDPVSGTVLDVAGTGLRCSEPRTCGASAEGSPALETALDLPVDISFDPAGDLLLAEETAYAYIGEGIGWRHLLRRIE